MEYNFSAPIQAPLLLNFCSPVPLSSQVDPMNPSCDPILQRNWLGPTLREMESMMALPQLSSVKPGGFEEETPHFR